MNVVLLTIDCLRADRVGFMGYDGGTTPFLDELAEQGVVFENAFATGPTTTQSMPGLMTGTYPSWFGGYPPIPKSQTTLAEAFSEAGYTTVGIHSNPWLHPSHRFDAGFDVYVHIAEGDRPGSRPEPKEGKMTSSSSVDEAKARVVERLKSTYYELPSPMRRAVSQGYFTFYYLFDRARDTAESAVDRAIEAMDEHGTDDLFLWIHFMDLHRPYTLSSAGIGDGIWQTARITQPRYNNPPPRDQDHISQVYDQCVSYVDEQIQRLYLEFERQGLEDETIVVVTSDHGEEFGEHDGWFHGNFKLYDELLHVPLLLFDPKSDSNRITDLVSLTDVAPTVLQRSIGAHPSFGDGDSLISSIDNTSHYERSHVVGEIYDPHRDKVAVRTDEWKLIRDEDGEELYRLTSDPSEQTDLSMSHETPDEIRQTLSRHEANRIDSPERELNSGVQARLRELGYLDEAS